MTIYKLLKFKHFKQHYEIIVAALAFAIVVFFYFYCRLDNSFFLGSLGVIATFYFGVLKYKIENDRVFQQLFTSLNSRYNNEFNNLINSLRGHSEKTLVVNEEKNDENLIIDYFNLCAEEFMWVNKKYIDKDI